MTMIDTPQISLHLVLAIVWLHWVADFVAQTNNMAINKSKSNKWLTIHVAAYSLFFTVFGIPFAVLNGLAHWSIDYVTSRVNSKLWAEKRVHGFFVGVGFDQALHYTFLFVSAYYLL